MKVYIVIELHKDSVPSIVGVYRSKTKAEAKASESIEVWRNVLEKTIE